MFSVKTVKLYFSCQNRKFYFFCQNQKIVISCKNQKIMNSCQNQKIVFPAKTKKTVFSRQTRNSDFSSKQKKSCFKQKRCIAFSVRIGESYFLSKPKNYVLRQNQGNRIFQKTRKSFRQIRRITFFRQYQKIIFPQKCKINIRYCFNAG